MTPEEKDIERYLFHEQYHFQEIDPAGVIIRRALKIVQQETKNMGENSTFDASQQVCFTKAGGQAGPCRQQLLQDHAKFESSPGSLEGELVKKDAFSLTQGAGQGNGIDTFCPARACNLGSGRNARGWQKKGDWGIFVPAGDRQAVFGSADQRVKLNPVILQFAKKFAAQLRLRPPLTTFDEVKAFCVKRNLIMLDPLASPRAHSPSEAATERRHAHFGKRPSRPKKNRSEQIPHCDF